ncbi:unnamed protein product [Ceutorhynchus assimilis]|uniref:Glucose-methanol-choline oxidoreductase C-terminal domain-containing protein n=1 Tax=Ceutorhynchus assimilis TaxID=467358 RepID=A0A9N9MQC7_9CUCU|nr:unnamed protein product [Ceutorhynchus assimilis]
MLLRAFKERGSIEVDYNGRTPYGVSRLQNFLDRNVRAGTAHAYIRPAADRPNLLINNNALGFHPMGSAMMGTYSSNSVTNPELKVHGIQRLRIADASVIPVTISGHITAPTVMVAEKVSDLIKAEHGQ